MVGEIFNQGERTWYLIFSFFYKLHVCVCVIMFIQFYLFRHMRLECILGFYMTSFLSPSGYPPLSHAAPCRHSAPFSYPSTPSSPPKKEGTEKKERKKREGKRKRGSKGKNLGGGETNLKKGVYGAPDPTFSPAALHPSPLSQHCQSTSGVFAHYFDLSSTSNAIYMHYT